MAMCPNCGQIIMNGDPYCSHCGTALNWSADDSSSRGGLFSEDVILRDIPITSFDMALERLNVSANTVRAIKGMLTSPGQGTAGLTLSTPTTNTA